MKVIVINGPMGVGKTTVGKYIADTHAGTAFIDGDWCLDLHPFVGNRETKTMAVDNILHMIRNYKQCSLCRQIVLVWLMDDPWVLETLEEGIRNMDLELQSVTLLCSEPELIRRWEGDKKCEWRTEEWLRVSLKSLDYFARLKDGLHTDGMTVSQVARAITEA